ncbi:MAG: DUF373 family protein, partial [Candidatus Aenigmarchaeota archaeon]|nr:DUF373 family protein [Candidatus Aenigmarchaeota archaeon]
MPKKERLLVLCVDRDDDLGRKAKIKGPVVGREQIMEAAGKLGLADPGDTDFNTMYQAVKVYDQMRKEYAADVAVITGKGDVGIESDREIARQLDSLLHQLNSDYALLVTDGAQDEHVLPVIQSRIPILSVNRLVVKQSERLESAYYQLKDFLEEMLDNPKYARLVFGLPGVLLLIVAFPWRFFNIDAWSAIFAVSGAYLLAKAFKLEDYLIMAVSEMKSAFIHRRLAFFSYIVALGFVVLGSYEGYAKALPFLEAGAVSTIAAFVLSSVFLYYLAGAIAWVGRYADRGVGAVIRSKIAAIPIFGFSVAL